jgi:hypothetical protein
MSDIPRQPLVWNDCIEATDSAHLSVALPEAAAVEVGVADGKHGLEEYLQTHVVYMNYNLKAQ